MLDPLHKTALSIELCSFSDVDKLIDFIDQNWKKNHIFTKDRKLFDWQHRGVRKYNFVLAKEMNEIVGILGYIPTSHYSDLLSKNNLLWLAIWKIKDGVKKPGLGLIMLNYLKKIYRNPKICSIGLSREVIPIYKALGFNVGVLSHRAFFNQFCKEFMIGKPDSSYLTPIKKNNLTFRVSTKVSKIPDRYFDKYPSKNSDYLINRYVNHPRYNYKFIYIYENKSLLSVSVFREINLNSTKVGRIVDSFGANIMISKFNFVISVFLRDFNYEYLDIVSNMDCDKYSGFIDASDSIIIPNYFEPFLKENISIDYAYKSEERLVIFRGDSDQDRPSYST